MNGKRAKQIRRQVYGDYSPKFREYNGENRKEEWSYPHGRSIINQYGTITADPRRQAYQKAKQSYINRRS